MILVKVAEFTPPGIIITKAVVEIIAGGNLR